MTNKTSINVAFVGFGFSGITFHAPFLRVLEAYNLCYVISSNLEKVKPTSQMFGLNPTSPKF